jgi:hypothetical protein
VLFSILRVLKTNGAAHPEAGMSGRRADRGSSTAGQHRFATRIYIKILI